MRQDLRLHSASAVAFAASSLWGKFGGLYACAATLRTSCHYQIFFGSAQEFVETRILGCFLQNDEFGLGDRHALRLEQQIAEILVATAPSKEGFDVSVDGFHHSEAHLGAAVVEDAVQVIQQQEGKLWKGANLCQRS
jgi:hypothetical protein